MHFPGAVKSKFVSDLSFVDPSTHPAIPTYRIMDSEGVIVDKNWKLVGASNEDVVQWYKNMVTGTRPMLLLAPIRPFLLTFTANSQYHGSHHE